MLVNNILKEIYDPYQYNTNDLYKYLFTILQIRYDNLQEEIEKIQDDNYNNLQIQDLGIDFKIKNLFNQEPAFLSAINNTKFGLESILQILLGVKSLDDAQVIYNPITNRYNLNDGTEIDLENNTKAILLFPNFSKSIHLPIYALTLSTTFSFWKALNIFLYKLAYDKTPIYIGEFTISPQVAFAVFMYLTNSVNYFKNLVVINWELLSEYKNILLFDLAISNITTDKQRYAISNTILKSELVENNQIKFTNLISEVLTKYPKANITVDLLQEIEKFLEEVSSYDDLNLIEILFQLLPHYLNYKHFYVLPGLLQKEGITLNIFVEKLSNLYPYNQIFSNDDIRQFIAKSNLKLIESISVDSIDTIVNQFDDIYNLHGFFKIVLNRQILIKNLLQKIVKYFGDLFLDLTIGKIEVEYKDYFAYTNAILEAYPTEVTFTLTTPIKIGFVADTIVEVEVNTP